MQYLLVLLAVFSVGCLPPTQFNNGVYRDKGRVVRWYPEDFPLEILVDAELQPTRVEALQEAVMWWNDVVGAEVFTITREISFYGREASHPPQGTLIVTEADLPELTPGLITQGYARLFWRGPKMRYVYVLIDWIVPTTQAKTVFAHELGHSLGLTHDESDRSLMFHASVNSQECILEDDIAFVRWEMQSGN